MDIQGFKLHQDCDITKEVNLKIIIKRIFIITFGMPYTLLKFKKTLSLLLKVSKSNAFCPVTTLHAMIYERKN